MHFQVATVAPPDIQEKDADKICSIVCLFTQPLAYRVAALPLPPHCIEALCDRYIFVRILEANFPVALKYFQSTAREKKLLLLLLLHSKSILKKFRLDAYQSSFRFDQWPIGAVHLVVEAAGVTEVVAVPIPPPQRGRGCSTVHTLTTLCKQKG